MSVSRARGRAIFEQWGRETRFICKVCEEPQLYRGSLSFVIRGSDRLSAIVRFGSNMSYVAGSKSTADRYSEPPEAASDDRWLH